MHVNISADFFFSLELSTPPGCPRGRRRQSFGFSATWFSFSFQRWLSHRSLNRSSRTGIFSDLSHLRIISSLVTCCHRDHKVRIWNMYIFFSILTSPSFKTRSSRWNPYFAIILVAKDCFLTFLKYLHEYREQLFVKGRAVDILKISFQIANLPKNPSKNVLKFRVDKGILILRNDVKNK